MSRAGWTRVPAIALALAASALLLAASPTAAHPLGNYSVNRALAVTVGGDRLMLRYVLDIAEIPAFREVQEMDDDVDGHADARERGAWAAAACDTALTSLVVRLDGNPIVPTVAGEPQLSFPPGAGGLETLRLVCLFEAGLENMVGQHALEIRDAGDDGRPGWRELTIAPGAGARLVTADVPVDSPSAQLTAYPAAGLSSPLDVRAGRAVVEFAHGLAPDEPGAVPETGEPAPTAEDPLASLMASAVSGGGALPALAAALLSLGLGAGHALSPGHGKTLIAAYLVGSRGSVRQGAALGLTVAVTHTLGVFVLGAITLGAGALVAPDDLLAALSVISGAIVLALGAGLVIGAVRRLRGPRPHADHHHPHGHAVHSHGRSDHGHHREAQPARGGVDGAPPRLGHVLALGLAGGIVPSASALIVLLVAVTTGQVALGMLLIVAFGVGMASVLGSFAIGAVWLQARIGHRDRPRLRRLGRLIPLISGLAVLGAGVLVTLQAVARLP